MGVLDGKQMILHVLFALAMGAVAAGASIVLCLSVEVAYRTTLEHWWLLLTLPLMGVLTLLLYHVWKLPLNTTTESVVENIRQDRDVSPWLAPGILIGTCMTILGGGSVGKEAGALHMGASLGDLVSRPFKLRSVHKRDWTNDREDDGMRGYAAATGMAATFSALFFAPIGSFMFVLELSRYKKSVLKHSLSILLACTIAFLIARVVGIGDIIPRVVMPALTWRSIGVCIVIAAVCALGGTLFIRSIGWLQKTTQKISSNYYLWVALGGIIYIALVLAFGWQAYEGTGGNQLALALQGKQADWGFAIKALITAVCLGFWFKGGEIMPTFTIGALLGASSVVMTGADPAASAAIGLVAFFAAVSRCPFAAFFMGCEIFGFESAPHLFLAVIIAMALGRDVGLYGEGARSAFVQFGRNIVHRTKGSAAVGAVAAAGAATVTKATNTASVKAAKRASRMTRGLQGLQNSLSRLEDFVERQEAIDRGDISVKDANATVQTPDSKAGVPKEPNVTDSSASNMSASATKAEPLAKTGDAPEGDATDGGAS